MIQAQLGKSLGSETREEAEVVAGVEDMTMTRDCYDGGLRGMVDRGL